MSTVPRFIESVDFPKLMNRFVPGLALTRRSIAGGAVSYLFSRGGKPFRTAIAAYANAEFANEAMRDQSAKMMIGPEPVPVKIGDELLLFRSGDSQGGSLLFRRSNVFVLLGPGLPMEERLALANNLDGALQSDAPEVKHVSNLKLPEILGVDLPKSMYSRQVALGKIELRGTAGLTFELGCDSGSVSLKNPPPTVVYTAPAEPLEHHFDIVLATAGNLVVIHNVTVSVTLGR